jgi:hypothetical protein
LAELVKREVSQLAGNELKDATAADCAIELAKQSQRQAALEIAQMIGGDSARRNILEKLALE